MYEVLKGFKMSRCNQLVRQLTLLRELSLCSIVGGRVTISELTKRLGTSRRTIYRDIDALDRAGFKTTGDKEGTNRGGVGLVAPLDFNARKLDFDDVVSLYLSDELLSLQMSDPDDYVHRLLKDLECNFHGNDQSVFKKVRSLVQVNKPFRRKHEGCHKIADTLSKALQQSRILRILYYSAHRDSEEWRVIHPYKATWTATAQYVEAFCETAGQMRTFATNRMTEVQLLDKVFVRKKEYQTYGNDKGFIIYDAEPVDVCLIFDKSKAYYARERDWGMDQKTETLTDGRVKVCFSASGMEQVAGFVMRWGGAVEVIEPLELREIVYRGAKLCVEKNKV